MTCGAELELPPTLRLLMVTRAAWQLDTKAVRARSALWWWDLMGQIHTVQGCLAGGVGNARVFHLDETVNARLQRLAVFVRAEARNTSATVHTGDDS